MRHILPQTRQLAIGERIYASIERRYQILHHGEDAELCDGLAAQLQQGQRDPFQVVLFEGPNYEAFTAPGRYIFISRAMVRLPISEDSIAFMIAHEIGHHQCGHLNGNRLPAWWRLSMPRDVVVDLIAMGVLRLMMRPEFELEADQAGLELCLGAGFSAKGSLRIFDLLIELAKRSAASDVLLAPTDVLAWLDRWRREHEQSAPMPSSTGEKAVRWVLGRPSLAERRTRLAALAPASLT